MVNLDNFITSVQSAAGLITQGTANSEYDRALMEMVINTAGLGLDESDLGTIDRIVRAIS